MILEFISKLQDHLFQSCQLALEICCIGGSGGELTICGLIHVAIIHLGCGNTRGCCVAALAQIIYKHYGHTYIKSTYFD